MKKLILSALCISALCACNQPQEQLPSWLEADADAAIQQRIRADFPYTVDEFFAIASEKDSTLTREEFDRQVALKYIETLEVDDTLKVHRKALRNMRLLNPAVSGWTHRGSDATNAEIALVDSILNPKLAEGAAHRIVYKYAIDVPNHSALLGDTLRVWMPLPMETQRQSNVQILEASHQYVVSTGKSIHNTIYFEAPVGAEGDTTHFEYTGSYDVKGEYFSAANILKGLRPYDTETEIYKTYTAFDNPHVVRLDSLAQAIADGETNPYKLSEKVFDYIAERYPWASAREYSTIPSLPLYVLEQGHGDCGQVTLLYISLMRTLGIPARWESGWVFDPGSVGIHDWAEVYFEGIGWVPVDPSAGRFKGADNADVAGFYSHGTNAYRFATNCGICGEFFPAKRYVRSETVDAQLGEVETSKGNLFYDGWKRKMTIISVKSKN